MHKWCSMASSIHWELQHWCSCFESWFERSTRKSAIATEVQTSQWETINMLWIVRETWKNNLQLQPPKLFFTVGMDTNPTKTEICHTCSCWKFLRLGLLFSVIPDTKRDGASSKANPALTEWFCIQTLQKENTNSTLPCSSWIFSEQLCFLCYQSPQRWCTFT